MAIQAHEDPAHGTGHAHPSDLQYVYVALVLGAITAAEIVLGYQDVAGLILGTMLVLMAVKFGIVALWFMHLRFDNVVFRRFFVTGILLAAAVYLGVMTSSQFFGADTTSEPLDQVPQPAGITR